MALRPVYSTQWYCNTFSGGTQFFTCPDGVVGVLRCMDVAELSGTAGTILLVESPAGATFWAAERTPGDALGVFQWQGRQVLAGGESIGFHVISGTWSIWASGYELPTP